MTDILMPALSPTMEEGGLAKWHVKPGDKIEAGQVQLHIEDVTVADVFRHVEAMTAPQAAAIDSMIL